MSDLSSSKLKMAEHRVNLRPKLQLGRRKFSPPRPRPVRSEYPMRAERNPYPGPAKKPRLEPHVPYVEAAKRPYAKPAHRPMEPRISNPPSTIEKRPVLLNAPYKSVSELQPLPQRTRPALKPQPTPAPPARPGKPAEKQTPIRPTQAPVKPAEKQMPVKHAVNQVAVKPAVNQVAVKPAVSQVAVKPAVNQVAVKPAVSQVAVKPAVNQVAVKPAVSQVAVKPAVNQVAVKSAEKQTPAKAAEKQMPVKPTETLMRVNPVEKQTPVKPAAKQVPVKAVVKQSPVKAAAPAEPVQKQPAKPVQMQRAPEKDERDPVEENVELTVDGNSLNSLASEILADEIKDIMDKVAQELPEAPTLDAEKLVVERFKTVVGDDIRNALGLNVTTRILDMHNPLYVKLGFSHKPEAGCLQAFIARFRVGAFKRVAAPGDTFAARLDCLRDFDRLCAEKKLRCGTASVTVTPCYKFLTCPSEIKSIYAVNNEVKTEGKTGNQNSNYNSVENTAEQGDDAAAKNYQKINDKEEIVSKVNDAVETVVEAKPVTPVKNSKPTPATPVKVNITIEAATKLDNNKDVPKENKLEIKDEVTRNIDIDLKIKKDILEETESSGITNIDKSESNVDNKTSEEAKNRSDEEMVDEQLGDEEEMTDCDILALMSGGIVLDECSGSDPSDDEK